MIGQLTVRPGTPEDTAAVAALEVEALTVDAWSEGLLAEGLAGRVPTTSYLVAESDGTLVGYAVTSHTDVAELQRIAVAGSHRRQGIASALLEAVASGATGCERLLLEVREDNAPALGFYAAHGFTELDRRPRYYADGTTAVVLAKELT